MSTAASSDLLVQASVTENTPGGKSCQDLASMYRTFPACGFAIRVQAQLVVQPLLSSGTPHPDKPLSSTLESPWDVFRESPGLGEASKRWAPTALKHLHQTLLSSWSWEHLMRTVKEQNSPWAGPSVNIIWLERHFFPWRSFQPVSRHYSASKQKNPLKNRTPCWRLLHF